jgi:hypothetical protein
VWCYVLHEYNEVYCSIVESTVSHKTSKITQTLGNNKSNMSTLIPSV